MSTLKRILCIAIIVFFSILVYVLIIKNNYDKRSEKILNETRKELIEINNYKNTIKIPRRIVQTIADKRNIDPYFQKNIEYIKRLNPNWEHVLFDNEDCEEYIRTKFPEYLPYYLSINAKYGAARADLFRYLYMYAEGGVYLDIKSAMKYPLDEIIYPNDEFILSHWPYPGFILIPKPFEDKKTHGEFQQWHIICAKEHPALKEVIHNVIKNIEKYDLEKVGVGKEAVLYTTGPYVYTKSILSVLHKHNFRIAQSNTDIGLIYNNIGTDHQSVFGKKHYKNIQEPVILHTGNFTPLKTHKDESFLTHVDKDDNPMKYYKNILEFSGMGGVNSRNVCNSMGMCYMNGPECHSQRKYTKDNSNLLTIYENIDEIDLTLLKELANFDCVVFNNSDDLLKLFRKKEGREILEKAMGISIFIDSKNEFAYNTNLLKKLDFTPSLPTYYRRPEKILYVKVVKNQVLTTKKTNSIY